MTVGPALIFLGVAENLKNSVASFFIAIGKVPMFYYILHLIILRSIGLALGGLNQYRLTTVYFAWIFVVCLLYFPCNWFAKYKAANPGKWWLSYL